MDNLSNYGVNVPNSVERVRASLYDSLTYLGAGQAQLLFFQVAKGSGFAVGSATAPKTLADTNMQASGLLPSPFNFLVQTIELFFFPGLSGTVTYVPGNPATTAATVGNFVNDVHNFSQGGWLDFFIGSKSYLDEAPLAKFPPRQALTVAFGAADHTTLAASSLTTLNYAALGGVPYVLAPPILLTPTQNFNVSLNWVTAVALPSTFPAKVTCSLNGILYRLSQ